MKLYLALIKDKEIGRLEFDWMPMVAALQSVARSTTILVFATISRSLWV